MTETTIHVPCYGSSHRVYWAPGKPIQLLDHDRQLRHVERHLAAACGDLDYWNWLHSTQVPPAGCWAVVTTVFRLFQGYPVPAWLRACRGAIEVITAADEAELKRLGKMDSAVARWQAAWPAGARRQEWQRRKYDRFLGLGLFGRNVQ